MLSHLSLSLHLRYVHLSREEGADLGTIKKAITDLRQACADSGVNVMIGFGPSLLKDITTDIPDDFQVLYCHLFMFVEFGVYFDR